VMQPSPRHSDRVHPIFGRMNKGDHFRL
jgi:hypothetical protein